MIRGIGKGLIEAGVEGVEVEAAPFAGEVCLGAEGSNKVVEGLELLELQVGQLVDEERVGEVVVEP